jgi:RHH-type proline utilization regulon transcriptional repressor/proline dehydrogenase/delta 1-pyrroline-5-carboxylate dehydrogenase
VRTGVRAGSRFHLTEFFGPILGVMTAATLEEAIALQNQVDYGLTSGLHSLNPREMAIWLGSIQAGNLYINRGITGAIVQRQPFGGWKKSAVGTGHKAGGPNYLFGLGGWAARPSTSTAAVTDARVRGLLAATRASVSAAEAAFLERSFASDSAAWAAEFGVARDVSALGVERNIFRYIARPVTVRLPAGRSLAALVRVAGAGILAGASLELSSAATLPPALREAMMRRDVTVRVETDADWLARAATLSAARIRLIGGNAGALAIATNGRPDIAVHSNPVTESGRLELLPFLAEQAVSITAHRFGTPNHLSDGVI